jgi:hypothetical protein
VRKSHENPCHLQRGIAGLQAGGQSLDARPSVFAPLNDLKVDEYANNEKISYLPRKLTEKGSGSSRDERLGDPFYYAPWAISPSMPATAGPRASSASAPRRAYHLEP